MGDILNERAFDGEDPALVGGDVAFGDKATGREEGITLEDTGDWIVLGKRLARKAWVRSCWGVSPCMSNKLTPPMCIFLTQAAFMLRDSMSSYEMTCSTELERR